MNESGTPIPVGMHIYPKTGGIGDYARAIDGVYKAQGLKMHVFVVKPTSSISSLLDALQGEQVDYVHIEMGAGDGALFLLSRQLLARTKYPQLVTIHDPGVTVWHPIAIRTAESTNSTVRLVGKVLRKVVNRTVGRLLVASWLKDPHITKAYLRQDLAEQLHGYYLPQPTYHATQPAIRPTTSRPSLVAFAGFWGLGKGIETLAEAWEQLKGQTDLKLIVAGGGAKGDDPYAAALRSRLQSLPNPPELPGFVSDADLDSFLTSLSTLVLPYWRELPSGSSAMAMRAAELGTPIIASDTLPVREQLGSGATYVEPGDAHELAEVLRKLPANWDSIQAQAQNTQEEIIANHNWHTVGERLGAIVASLGVKQ